MSKSNPQVNSNPATAVLPRGSRYRVARVTAPDSDSGSNLDESYLDSEHALTVTFNELYVSRFSIIPFLVSLLKRLRSIPSLKAAPR